ncbi:hypothetical protein ONS96_007741 [Cadophora gregata f. sp. sojae]|nr:hypothetical protein ONS96_007741 [Cadophora gregata f. sp. sojae]
MKRDEFIGSIDTDAIRALASSYNGGLPCSIRSQRQGSFNVCFILDFSDGTTRLVRLPIEPAVHDVWDKVRSEVCTMQYVLDHTDIRIPRVYAYGKSRLRRDTSTYQVFMVLDYIDGRPLTKKLLRDSPEDSRRRFFGEIVDMFAELRRLEFPLGGSLMPNTMFGTGVRLWSFLFSREESFTPQSIMGLKHAPKIVGAFSMRKNELQVDGFTAVRSIAATANEFLRDQYQLLQYMWQMPSQELGQEEAEYEEFALNALSLEEAQRILGFKADSSGGSFCLSHPDLRVNNIIVDDELHIRGIVDWEFSVTVPQPLFLPPPWITGHDSGSVAPKVSFEFMNVLSSRKSKSPSHSQLAREWDFQDNFTLPMAYIFRDPSDLVLLFYRCIYPRLYNDPRDKIVPSFFQRPENKELQERLTRRLGASKEYTQYLRDNDLFDDEEDPEWQKLKGWTTEAQNKLQELREWSDKTQGEITRLEGERPVQPVRAR